MRDPVRVSQLVGVWLKRACRSSGHHCPVVSAASCGFTAAPDRQFASSSASSCCSRSPWLLPFLRADSQEELVLFPILQQHSGFTLLKKFSQASLPTHALTPAWFFISAFDAHIFPVSETGGYALALGDDFWFLVSSAHRVAFF